MKSSVRRMTAQKTIERMDAYYLELNKLREADRYDDRDEETRQLLDKNYERILNLKGLYAASTSEQLGTRRVLELCDIYDRMTAEEKERLHASPLYSNDVRDLGDLRDSYGLSWNELRELRTIEDDDKEPNFADRLNLAIAATGLTRRAFAAAIGSPLRSVENWLAGSRTPTQLVQDVVLTKAKKLIK